VLLLIPAVAAGGRLLLLLLLLLLHRGCLLRHLLSQVGENPLRELALLLRPEAVLRGDLCRRLARDLLVLCRRLQLSEVLRANPDVPYEQRIQTARFIEDLTAGYQGGWYSVISLHGGGSPAAMKQEIYRNYPIGSKVELVERLLERGIAADGSAAPAPHDPARAITQNRQPGKCCDTGCTVPGTPMMVDLPTVEATLPSKRLGLKS
jgi:hypothetical protein